MEKLTTKGFGSQGLVYGRRGFTWTLRQWLCTHGDAISSGLGRRDHTEGLRKLVWLLMYNHHNHRMWFKRPDRKLRKTWLLHGSLVSFFTNFLAQLSTFYLRKGFEVCGILKDVVVPGKRNILLQQNMFNIVTLSFDNNKVLKVQLDMIIFVQMCMIIY